MSAPRCTIVIPTFNRAVSLKETLGSLNVQLDQDFDVIVVSDGEDVALRSASQSIHAPFPLTWIFHANNRGQAAARNTGAAAATGDFLLFLDDDTPAAPDLLTRHVARHLSAAPQQNLAVVGKVVELRREPLTLPTVKFLQDFRQRDLETYARLTGAAG
ncbi:MAG: glycosyltransferase family A protein, partial [Terracidiphilus sp.]